VVAVALDAVITAAPAAAPVDRPATTEVSAWRRQLRVL
jgi:hypothetical protein